MDVSQLLREAWEAVDAAGLPEPVQTKAFELAVLVLSGGTPATKQATNPPADFSGTNEKPSQSPTGGTAPSGDPDLLNKVAHEAGVEVGALEEVLHFDEEGQPHVTGPARRLGRSMAAQARTVAVLITAARSLALDETNVASRVVRSECAALKCFDSNNFGSHTASTPGLVTIGNGASRTFKLKSGEPGLKAFREALDFVRGVKADS